MKQRIVIVGAGPIGCYLSQLLRREGLNSLLIEEHKEIGRPVHCTGLVGEKVFREAKIPLERNTILNTINGAVINLGRDRFILKKKSVAYVVDRDQFDKQLSRGLSVELGIKCLGIEAQKKGYIVETDRGGFQADIVIGTDGVNSVVRQVVDPSFRVTYLKGVQFRIKGDFEFKDLVEVYVKKPYFYWIVPEGDNVARVGVISKNPYYDLSEFIKCYKIKGRIIEKFAGIVPLNYSRNLSRDRLFLVGDSASCVKPLTYGGIYTGMRSAEILADCITKEKFSDYSYIWAKRFNREIKTGLKARDVFQHLSKKDVKRIFDFAKKNAKIIEENGNFESHASLIWYFLKRPKVLKEISDIFLSVFWSLFKGE
ncbi:MAG: NAD(P)/FAD-dependent oxidoreductase [Candidatus Omnitrophica bacterium]|nr:NAD(P)/FAD-dependent oxidoreductase [Candidatus Omnitrophota bacterium]MDD5430162.1 NAD(P)/FAD-dependent oxidoreductase [Candidatus Omnitrophota bacterium]